MRLITVLLAGLLVLGAAPQAAAQIPTPVLKFDGAEYYQTGGKTWVRYKLRVVNWANYADALFDPAPNLPPLRFEPELIAGPGVGSSLKTTSPLRSFTAAPAT